MSLSLSDLQKARDLIMRERRTGTAFVRQSLFISDSKAKRILEALQAQGILSKPDASGARQILRTSASVKAPHGV